MPTPTTELPGRVHKTQCLSPRHWSCAGRKEFLQYIGYFAMRAGQRLTGLVISEELELSLLGGKCARERKPDERSCKGSVNRSGREQKSTLLLECGYASYPGCLPLGSVDAIIRTILRSFSKNVFLWLCAYLSEKAIKGYLHMLEQDRYSGDDPFHSGNLPRKRGNIVKLPRKLDDPIKEAEWYRHLTDPTTPRILDLFCGAGGLSEGFVQQGFVVAAACDYDLDACRTFEANIAAHVIHTDIKNIVEPESLVHDLPIPQIDVIVGGPPCQGFSVYGRGRLGRLDEDKQRDLLARNNLYQDFFRFVEAFLPSFFVMENVPMLLKFQNKAYMRAIQLECQRLGYSASIQVVDAADYGVPQFRRRLFIIGNRIGRLFRWPHPTHRGKFVSLQEAISDLPEVLPPSEEECLHYNNGQPLSEYQQWMRYRVPQEDRAVIYDHIVRPVRKDDEYIFKHMKPGDRYIDIEPDRRRYKAETFHDKYYMLQPDKPGTTITAHIAKDGYRYIHWDINQHRTLSVREAARIQSFGDHFRFSGSRTSRFRQIGNAVPPLLASVIAKQLYLAIKNQAGSVPGAQSVQLPLPGCEQWNRPALSPEIITPSGQFSSFTARSHILRPKPVELWTNLLTEEHP